MKKSIFLIVLALIFVSMLVITALAENSLTLIKVRGNVNTAEIGGNGLCVFSIWDKNKNSFVGSDGSFNTIISDSRPQKLSIKDVQKNTRALSIVIPGDSTNVVFDAKSTAEAILFRDPEPLATSSSVKEALSSMAKSLSFKDLTDFLKKKLPGSSLEELMVEPEFISLMDKCNSEVFGQDTGSVTKSLYVAKDRLEKLLQEK